ncbi:fatty acid desaturase family protein [Nocardia sp. NPDC088792]|uniref:fatty acid desaturase family protein n=1 Tax=Nocardia sp. NPDC088792 TaxID=3364332 RepID=UPI00380702AD
MAIRNIERYSHLTRDDIDELGQRLDLIRKEVEDSLGERDARYIRRAIAFQRSCEVAARIVLLGSAKRPLWLLGAGLLALSKSIENMEIGHNVMHGQWDWMNDPDIHSASWEWDHSMPASHWKEAHNFQHHAFANVLGMDPDEGYGLLRITRDRRWRPYHLGNALYLVPISLLYEFGMCVYHLEIDKVISGMKDRSEFESKWREISRKAAKQLLKDYVVHPALTGRAWQTTLTANVTATLIKNVWEQIVTFCGHFPDGAEKFTRRAVERESRGEWYLRQYLGSANLDAGPVLEFLTGHLCYQIEHHLFPDLPSNRLREVAERVREVAHDYDLPYTTGSLPRQYLLTLRTILKLSLPDKFLIATSHNAPETSSERRFERAPRRQDIGGGSPRRRGLASALAETSSAVTLRNVIARQRIAAMSSDEECALQS